MPKVVMNKNLLQWAWPIIQGRGAGT